MGLRSVRAPDRAWDSANICGGSSPTNAYFFITLEITLEALVSLEASMSVFPLRQVQHRLATSVRQLRPDQMD